MKTGTMLPRRSIILWILNVFSLPSRTYSTASKTARSWHPLTLQQLANNKSEAQDTAPFDGGFPDIQDFDWSASMSTVSPAASSRKAVALGHKRISLLATATGEYSASHTEAPLDMRELQAPGSDSAVPVKTPAEPVLKSVSLSPSSSGFLQFPPPRISAPQSPTTLQGANEDQKLISQAVALQEKLNNKLQVPPQQITSYRNYYRPTTTLQASKTATEMAIEDPQPPTISRAVSEDEELRKKAANLQQELNRVRRALGPKPPQVAADKKEPSSSFRDVLLRAVARDDEATTTTLEATDVAIAAAAAVAELYQNDFSVYAQIGLCVSLGLQLALVAAIVSFVWQSDRLNYDDFGNGLSCGMVTFFVLSDVVWGYVLMTGVVDSYIEQFLICLLLGFILFGHIVAIFFIAHTWAQKAAYNLYHDSGVEKAALTVLNIENKIDAITSKMGVSMPRVLHNNVYDSETEGGDNPAGGSDNLPPPPDEDAEKIPIRVTMVKAVALRDADGNLIKTPKFNKPKILERTLKSMEDTSDPYCTCAVRGRKAACWVRSPAVQNNTEPKWNYKFFIDDFRKGDTLKFKVWDSDMGLSSELLGAVPMPYDEVIQAIADGHETRLVLKVPAKLEKQDPGKQSLLFVKIEKKTLGMNLRASVQKEMEIVEEELVGDGHVHKARICC